MTIIFFVDRKSNNYKKIFIVRRARIKYISNPYVMLKYISVKYTSIYVYTNIISTLCRTYKKCIKKQPTYKQLIFTFKKNVV